MRKIKPGSPFLRGVKPWEGKRARRPKSEAVKHSQAPASLRRTRKLYEEKGSAYDFGSSRLNKFLHSSAARTLTNQ